MNRKETLKFIESLKKLRESLSDQQASTAAEVYPTLKGDNELVAVGTRINWKGEVMRAAVDLWDTAENNPDNAPTLWETIDYKDGYRNIPETITVGTAFAYYEIGWWKDQLYRSLIDSNVYTPEQYPAGWELYVAE